jgi:hypothetical protein
MNIFQVGKNAGAGEMERLRAAVVAAAKLWTECVSP